MVESAFTVFFGIGILVFICLMVCIEIDFDAGALFIFACVFFPCLFVARLLRLGSQKRVALDLSDPIDSLYLTLRAKPSRFRRLLETIGLVDHRNSMENVISYESFVLKGTALSNTDLSTDDMKHFDDFHSSLTDMMFYITGTYPKKSDEINVRSFVRAYLAEPNTQHQLATIQNVKATDLPEGVHLHDEDIDQSPQMIQIKKDMLEVMNGLYRSVRTAIQLAESKEHLETLSEEQKRKKQVERVTEEWKTLSNTKLDVNSVLDEKEKI